MGLSSVYAFLAAVTCFLLRLYCILPGGKTVKKRSRARSESCSLAVFLGSGGHTSEALMLLSSLDFSRYCPRMYIISEGDTLSAQKALSLESVKAADCHPRPKSEPDASFSFITIPRARRVHQTLFTTPCSAARSLIACLIHVTLVPVLFRKAFPEVLILNGPGTCFVLCVSAYLNRFFGIPSPKLIYVESFARVRTLSLSARLLRPFVDR
ncbi:hypothetical protein AcW1_009120 [Taiwanofungus camphoratus]|nr:hypothetical protein AcV5_007143 [Antrodia cinnamomea]KAI0949533.1 hypothetical protein AcW1_009120 [Antrodia cinnamomea]KAI0958649.1 hypothetical protein AcV7_004404 [Antrodia cinnamomea]